MKLLPSSLLLVTLAALGCTTSSTSGGGAQGDFSCGTIAASASTVGIAAAPSEPPSFPNLAGGELSSGRWVLESIQPTYTSSDTARLVDRKVGLALELENGKFTAATTDSNGFVARTNGTFVVQGTNVKFTTDCRPDNEPDGTKPELTVSDVAFQVDGSTLTLRGYISEVMSEPNSTTATAVPADMVLKRQ